MKKNKLWIILSIGLVLIAVVVVIVILVTNQQEEIRQDSTNNISNVQNHNTGMLQAYIANLSDNYYIKYYGKFKDNFNEYVDSVIEYTKSGENFGFRSNEINMYLVYKDKKLYTISHRYKLIVEIARLNLNEYNLASDIGQVFVKGYNEYIGSTEYAVEEYLYNGNTLKYYFKDNDIKLIKYDEQDIRIIRVENKANQELLTIPSSYSYGIE